MRESLIKHQLNQWLTKKIEYSTFTQLSDRRQEGKLKMELGQNIKKLRSTKKLTQKQLAEILHVTPQAISKWENNKSYPDLETLMALSDYFQVSVDSLLGQKAPNFLRKLFGKKKEQPVMEKNFTDLKETDQKKIMIFDINVDLMQDGLMQTQLLATKMQNLSRRQGENYLITGHSAAKLKKIAAEATVILLMPTYGYAKKEIEAQFPDKPVIVISKREYGLLNAADLLEKIEEALKNS